MANPTQKTGSRWKNSRGYIELRIWISDTQVIQVKEHRYLMEQHIGRKLKTDENVHHLNGIRDDNRLENLAIISHSDHAKLHQNGRKNKPGYKLNLTDEERKARSIKMKAYLKQRYANHKYKKS